MARNIAAAATGRAALAPALAVDSAADGAPLWRYVMGRQGPEGACPVSFLDTGMLFSSACGISTSKPACSFRSWRSRPQAAIFAACGDTRYPGLSRLSSFHLLPAPWIGVLPLCRSFSGWECCRSIHGLSMSVSSGA